MPVLLTGIIRRQSELSAYICFSSILLELPAPPIGAVHRQFFALDAVSRHALLQKPGQRQRALEAARHVDRAGGRSQIPEPDPQRPARTRGPGHPIAVVDGLKGLPEAIKSQFPQPAVQTGIVHLLRHSMRFVSWKERKAVAAALKEIRPAANAEAAADRLDAFEQDPLGQKHPPSAECRRRQGALSCAHAH